MNIPEQAFSALLDLAEDRLARAGIAVVSSETAALIEDVERRIGAGSHVSSAEYEAILYAVYSGPYGEYHRAKVFA